MKKISGVAILLGLLCCISCTTPMPEYETAGTAKDGNVNVYFIVVNVPDLKEISMGSLEEVVKDLIKKSDAQQMYEANTAYYFFDKSQQVEINIDYTRRAKAYYWYLTRLLIRGSERTEIKWK